MIDWDRVAELRDEIGAEDLAEVLDMFLTEVREKLDEVRAGTSTARLDEDMHFLKSSALNIGFTDLSDLCGKAEITAAGGCGAVALDAIELCYRNSCAELKADGARYVA